MGRPTKPNKEAIFEAICTEIGTTSKGLHKICKEHGIAPKTFFEWIKDNEELSNRYVRAREEQAELLADQIIEIADDSSGDVMTIQNGKERIEVENTEFVNRSKLRVEARKWVAAKLKPKKYSDKMDITSANEKIQSASPELLQAIASQIIKNSNLSGKSVS